MFGYSFIWLCCNTACLGVWVWRPNQVTPTHPYLPPHIHTRTGAVMVWVSIHVTLSVTCMWGMPCLWMGVHECVGVLSKVGMDVWGWAQLGGRTSLWHGGEVCVVTQKGVDPMLYCVYLKIIFYLVWVFSSSCYVLFSFCIICEFSGTVGLISHKKCRG